MSDVVEERVRSQDGTSVGFLRQGRGPGLVLVQGAMAAARDYRDLAGSLAAHFSVFTPDRRGRGMSPKPYSADHVIERDVDDVAAVLAATGASRVFGLSSGAMVTLAAALALPQIGRVAVYEPPLRPGGPPRARIERLNREIERGRLPAALVTSLQTAQTAPAPLRLLPRPVARTLAAGALALDARRGPSPTLRDLLPGIRYDFHDVATMNARFDALASLTIPVLLLSGTKSPAYLRKSVRQLDAVLPHSQLVELDGLSHSGPWNPTKGGRPLIVAAALRDFFA